MVAMPRLHVNIDHVATVRQARLDVQPDPVFAASICELAGANGITVHLREDRRHIQDRDVRLLKETVKTMLNLEIALTEEMTNIAIEILPDQVCIVPEGRNELTTEGGLNINNVDDNFKKNFELIKAKGIETSLFVDPSPEAIEGAAKIGADFVELHTGPYAKAKRNKKHDELKKLQIAALYANELGLRVNAGHGLNYDNVMPIAQLPNIEELNIGFAIISRAIYVGLDQAVREMQDRILSVMPPEQM